MERRAGAGRRRRGRRRKRALSSWQRSFRPAGRNRNKKQKQERKSVRPSPRSEERAARRVWDSGADSRPKARGPLSPPWPRQRHVVPDGTCEEGVFFGFFSCLHNRLLLGPSLPHFFPPKTGGVGIRTATLRWRMRCLSLRETSGGIGISFQ